ncbi:MAG: hypothetical protein NTY19_39335 [Planctomycetota bacterium]|nr:hypothetical protein [Planctomycetota bacterium]
MHQPQLVINLYGGLVRDVFCSVPGLQLLVVDWDVGDAFPGEPSIVDVALHEGSCAAHVRDMQLEPLSELAGTDTGAAIEAAYEQGVLRDNHRAVCCK